MVNVLAGTGRLAIAFLAAVGQLGFFTSNLAGWLVRPPFWSEIIVQAVRIGVYSAPIVAAINFFVGANVALVGHAIFSQFGGQGMIGIYVGLSCIIGMAPIIVGAMLGAKPGTEIAATIASMRVKEQIDALEVMAVNPYWYLVVPRFLAFLIVTPGLIVVADFASVAGGYVAAVYQLGTNPGTFMADVLRFLSMGDLVKGLIRGEIFAAIICVIACYYGYYSRPGPAGVSRAINLGVVFGSVSIIVINYFLTELMY